VALPLCLTDNTPGDPAGSLQTLNKAAGFASSKIKVTFSGSSALPIRWIRKTGLELSKKTIPILFSFVAGSGQEPG
jgi:hypothetical protein